MLLYIKFVKVFLSLVDFATYKHSVYVPVVFIKFSWKDDLYYKYKYNKEGSFVAIIVLINKAIFIKDIE